MVNKTKIVIADDMEPILLYLEKIVENIPEFEIVGKAKNGKELIDLVIKQRPELVITDVEMPEYTGIQVVEEMARIGIKLKFILITGSSSCIITSKASEMGILAIIKKPILDDNKFVEQIKQLIAKPEPKNKAEQIKLTKVKKENVLVRIINKFFKSK